MAKHKPKTSVPAKSNGRCNSALARGSYNSLALTHCFLTSPYQYFQHGEVRDPCAKGSIALYDGLHPQDALQSVLATLIVGVSNAANDCLSLAARIPPEAILDRDVYLRHAFKGAAVVTQLVEAFERVRGNRSGDVSVGNVNVQSGGQAIVGTVQSSQRSEDAGDKNGAASPKDKK
jgi:hypothetical protein